MEQTANGLGLTYTANPALSMSGLKYWRVRAVNVNLEVGAWSAARAITIKALPPTVPAFVSPASNALVTDYTPMLDWSVRHPCQRDQLRVLPGGSCHGCGLSEHRSQHCGPHHAWRDIPGK